MKQKLLSLILCFCALLSLGLNASAVEVLPMVIDQAGLFLPGEAAALEEKSLALRDAYSMDVVILTVDSLGGAYPENFADDYYDNNGYGFDTEGSGILFLLSMEERDWYISTCGTANYVLSDYGIQASAEEALPYFSSGNYYDGFDAWLDCLEACFEDYESDEPLDGYADLSGDYYIGTQEEIIYYEDKFTPSILLSLIAGLAVAAITVGIMSASMNTKRSQQSAQTYFSDGAFHLRTRQDVFLYSNVTKTPKPQNTGGSLGGSRGGGSSVHRSSSGRRHGGGGGKF